MKKGTYKSWRGCLYINHLSYRGTVISIFDGVTVQTSHSPPPETRDLFKYFLLFQCLYIMQQMTNQVMLKLSKQVHHSLGYPQSRISINSGSFGLNLLSVGPPKTEIQCDFRDRGRTSSYMILLTNISVLLKFVGNN